MPISARACSGVRPRTSSSPARRLRLWRLQHVTMRSPMPASPENVSGRAPQALPRRASSRRPRLMRPALALSPSSRPSTPPAARAMTFLVAAQSSTPTTSSLAYTRKAGEMSACWSSTASSESALATTVAAGSPSPISSAWFGPERTATGRSRTSSERRRPLSGSSPFVSTSTGQRPGSSRVTSAKARLGTATATRSASATGASGTVVTGMPDRSTSRR